MQLLCGVLNLERILCDFGCCHYLAYGEYELFVGGTARASAQVIGRTHSQSATTIHHCQWYGAIRDALMEYVVIVAVDVSSWGWG